MSGRTVRLVDLVQFNPPTPKGLLQRDDEVAVVPMAAVSELGSMRVHEHKPASMISPGLSYFGDGDVLVAKITPCYENNKITVANIDREHGFGSTEFHVIRPDASQLDSRYLNYFLRQDSIREKGRKRMTGSGGQRRVPKPFLEALEVPLPPLEEQRRIAAILDQTETLRRKRRQALTRLDALDRSVFHALCGDPVSNSKNWRDDLVLGDVAEIASGVTKGRKVDGKATRTVPYLAVANVQDRFLALDAVKQIEATETEIDRYRLRRDDLLLTEGGDPDKLGRGALWRDEIPEAIHQNHVFRVRITSAQIDPVYLNWLIGSRRGKQYFLRAAKQTTGIASINMGQLKNFPLLIPPIEIQEYFAQAVERVGQQRVDQQRHLACLDALFACLQHRAFSGDL